ncbi:MAG TPA: hypothetical protein EYQ60_05860 [Myxococcales bacterium]|nr:hypothetical protein [Myxococcales bacterium]HIK85451.1 hypothetical protein [Myxococcales bacterium]
MYDRDDPSLGDTRCPPSRSDSGGDPQLSRGRGGRCEGSVPRVVAFTNGASDGSTRRSPDVFGPAVSKKESGFSGDLFLWKTDDDFRDWVFESPAARIAQQVLGGTKIRHFYDQTFVKLPGCHLATPWHHDITFWPIDVESRSLCSIWITFDPVDRKSSGLEFVRGSQRWPRRSSGCDEVEATGLFFWCC